MNKYYPPNETQMRTAVKGADRHDYYKRRRVGPVVLLRLALLLIFFALVGFVFLFGILEWTK